MYHCHGKGFVKKLKCSFTFIMRRKFVLRLFVCILQNGPLARYVKLRVAHAPGMPGTFSPPPRASNPDMHHGTCVTHVPWCMPGSLTSSFFCSRWLGKRSRHSRRMRNPQFYVSGKRPMLMVMLVTICWLKRWWWWCQWWCDYGLTTYPN